jgi:transposase
MHQPYQVAVNNVLPNAEIVHDRYHIKAHLNGAVDKVRRAEHKKLSADGDQSLSGKRYVFLRNPDSWSEQEALCFEDLAAMQLKVTRAWWLKELFDNLYTYRSEAWARRFFDRWFFRATHSHLEPICKVAWMVKRHFANIVTYLKHRITNAVAEWLNSKIQVIKSAARGFRNFQNYRIAILFHCGSLDLLPTP